MVHTWHRQWRSENSSFTSSSRQEAEDAAERQRHEENRRRQEAEERQQKEEAERQRKETEERQQKEEAERQRKEAEERQQKEEAERQRKEAEERQQTEEAERQRKETEERQQTEEAERRRQEAEERQQTEEAERQRYQKTEHWVQDRKFDTTTLNDNLCNFLTDQTSFYSQSNWQETEGNVNQPECDDDEIIVLTTQSSKSRRNLKKKKNWCRCMIIRHKLTKSKKFLCYDLVKLKYSKNSILHLIRAINQNPTARNTRKFLQFVRYQQEESVLSVMRSTAQKAQTKSKTIFALWLTILQAKFILQKLQCKIACHLLSVILKLLVFCSFSELCGYLKKLNIRDETWLKFRTSCGILFEANPSRVSVSQALQLLECTPPERWENAVTEFSKTIPKQSQVQSHFAKWYGDCKEITYQEWSEKSDINIFFKHALKHVPEKIALAMSEKFKGATLRQSSLISYISKKKFKYWEILIDYHESKWVQASLYTDIMTSPFSEQNNIFYLKRFHDVIHDLSKKVSPHIAEFVLHEVVINQKLQKLHLNSVCNLIQELLEFERERLILETQVGYTFSEQDELPTKKTISEINPSLSSVEALLEAVEDDKNPSEMEELRELCKQHCIPPEILEKVLNKSNVCPSESMTTSWIADLKEEVLVQKLGHPQLQTSSFRTTLSCLIKRCSFKDMSDMLDKVKITGANVDTFKYVLNQLEDYNSDLPTCKSVFTVLEREEFTKWKTECKQLIIKGSFGEGCNQTTEELITYIAEHSPSIEFCQMENTKNFMQNLLTTKNSRSDWFLEFSKNNLDFKENTAETKENNKNQKIEDKNINEWSKDNIKTWVNCFEVAGNSKPSRLELIAVVSRALNITLGIELRENQLLSLGILLNPKKGSGCLVQIPTGQGKSAIVAVFACIQALEGRSVDVLTTSRELSIPELEKYLPLFKLLGLTAGENGGEVSTKKSVYEKNIVYGTISEFIGDILRTEYLGQDVRGKRKFDIVIADEVDSMLYDNLTQSIRLANNLPELDHLVPLFAIILLHIFNVLKHFRPGQGKPVFVSDPETDEEGQVVENPEEFITEEVTKYILEVLRDVSDEDMKKIEQEDQINQDIVSLGREISNLNSEEEAVDKSLKIKTKEKELEELQKKLQNLPKTLPTLPIPSHLLPYAKSQLKIWISNGLASLTYKKNCHYSVYGGRIVPIDYENTGVYQHNTVWNNGLSQFVQVKEGIEMTSPSVTTNYMSIVAFFDRYGAANTFGLTGTLGNVATYDFLRNSYGTDIAFVPSYSIPKIVGNEFSLYSCKELPAIVLSTEEKWIQKIADDALSEATSDRGVLLIFEHVEKAKYLEHILKTRYSEEKIFSYTGQEDFRKRDIDSGELIISTNIAGRGTDIKPSISVENNGGLHVIMTFLPVNGRVELQNSGRTGRQGNKGTARMIVFDKMGTPIGILKEQRNAKEKERAVKAKNDIQNMRIQDRLFVKYCNLQKELFPGNVAKNIEGEITMESLKNGYFEMLGLAEHWAFWHNDTFVCHADLTEEEIKQSFEKFRN